MRELSLQRAWNVVKFPPLLNWNNDSSASSTSTNFFKKEKKEAEKIGIVATRKTSLPKNSPAIVDPVSRRAV